jgi:hypothetical protein
MIKYFGYDLIRYAGSPVYGTTIIIIIIIINISINIIIIIITIITNIAILLQRRIHPFLRKRYHRNHQLLLLFLLVCINAACVTGSLLLALEKDISWLNAWWGSCVLFVFLDLFVFQVICSAMVDFAIPNIIYDRYRQLN